MKNIFFYGDSFTAGDELSDEIFFPWKSQCRSVTDYHQKRKDCLSNDKSLAILYSESNKSLAYPKKIESETWKIYNQADNGSSLKSLIVKSLKDIISSKVDFIVFQVPVSDREFYLDGDEITSIQFNRQAYKKNLNDYIAAKLQSHSGIQQSLEDILDLIVYDGFLISKDIPHLIVFFDNHFETREEKIKDTDYKNLLYLLERSKNVLFFQDFNIKEQIRLMAGHYPLSVHQEIADFLKDKINETLPNSSF